MCPYLMLDVQAGVVHEIIFKSCVVGGPQKPENQDPSG